MRRSSLDEENYMSVAKPVILEESSRRDLERYARGRSIATRAVVPVVRRVFAIP
jgi:hypothetical protein